MIQFGGVKLKVEPPTQFVGGSKDNYEDFERRLRTYLSPVSYTHLTLPTTPYV